MTGYSLATVAKIAGRGPLHDDGTRNHPFGSLHLRPYCKDLTRSGSSGWGRNRHDCLRRQLPFHHDGGVLSNRCGLAGFAERAIAQKTSAAVTAADAPLRSGYVCTGQPVKRTSDSR